MGCKRVKKYFPIFLIFLTITLSLNINASNIENTNITVGIKYGASSVTTESFESSNGFTIGLYDNNVVSNAVKTVSQKLTALRNGTTGNIDIHDTNNNVLLSINPGNKYIKLEPEGDDATKTIKIGIKSYRGSALLNTLKCGNDRFNVINQVNIEKYLYSVVPAEMSASWNIEALKAQAVACRTYVLKNKNKHSSYGFNVCTGIDCQVYGGYSSEYPNSNKAVDLTKGQLIYYNNQIIDAVFFGTSGGKTEDSSNVWVSQIPYLVGVDDSLEPASATNKTWIRKFTADDVKKLLKVRGTDIGDIMSITVNTASRNGRVISLSITGTNGQKTLEKESISGLFKLPSTWVTITASGGNGQSQFDFSLYAQNSNNDIQQLQPNSNTYILSSNGTSLNTLNGNSIEGSSSTKTVISTTPEASAQKNFVFSGRGNGHGIGMSQFGAKGMADSGYDYISILKHYYTGVDVR